MDSDSFDFEEAERLGKIVLVCAPTSVRCDFPLEAVALDNDGRIVRLANDQTGDSPEN